MLQNLPPELLSLVLQHVDLASLLNLHQVLPNHFNPFNAVFQTIYIQLVPYVWSVDDLDDLQSLLVYQINETQKLNHMPLPIFIRFMAKYNHVPQRLVIDLWLNFVLLKRLQPFLLISKNIDLTVLGWIPLSSIDNNNLDLYRFTSIRINSSSERKLLQHLPNSLKFLELDLDDSSKRRQQPVTLQLYNLQRLTLINDEGLSPHRISLVCPNLTELILTISNNDVLDWCVWLNNTRTPTSRQLESLTMNIGPSENSGFLQPSPQLELFLPDHIKHLLLKLANLDLFECPALLDLSESTCLTSLTLENVIVSQLELPETLSKLVIDINHDNGFRLDSFNGWVLPKNLSTFELHSSWFIELFDLKLPTSVSTLRLMGIPVEKWVADLQLPNLQTAVIVTSRVSDDVEDPPALKAFLSRNDEHLQTQCIVGPFHTTYYISSALQLSKNDVFKQHQTLLKRTVEDRGMVRITSIADFFHFPAHIDSINITLHQPDHLLLKTFGEFLLGSNQLTRLNIAWHSNSFSEVLLPSNLKDCSIKAHTPIQVSDFHTPTSEGLDTIFNTKNCLGLRRLEIVGVRTMEMDFNKFPSLHTLITDSDIQQKDYSLTPFVHVKNLKCLQPIAGLQNVDFELFPNLQTLDCQLPMANSSLRLHGMTKLCNLRMTEHQFTFTSIPSSLPSSLRILHFTTIGDNLRLDARQCHNLFVISFQLLQLSVIKSLIDSLPTNNSLNAICPHKDLGNLYEGGYECIRRHFPKLVPLINLGPVPQSSVFDTTVMCK